MEIKPTELAVVRSISSAPRKSNRLGEIGTSKRQTVQDNLITQDDFIEYRLSEAKLMALRKDLRVTADGNVVRDRIIQKLASGKAEVEPEPGLHKGWLTSSTKLTVA